MLLKKFLVLGFLLFSVLEMNSYADSDYVPEKRFHIHIDLPKIPLPRIPIRVTIPICNREFSINIVAAEACRISLSGLSACSAGATPACYGAIGLSASLCNMATEDIRRACLE